MKCVNNLNQSFEYAFEVRNELIEFIVANISSVRAEVSQTRHLPEISAIDGVMNIVDFDKHLLLY
jgi:hypothetical protein